MSYAESLAQDREAARARAGTAIKHLRDVLDRKPGAARAARKFLRRIDAEIDALERASAAGARA